MNPGWIIFIVVTVVIIVALVVLYFMGEKMQKKQLEQKKAMVAAAQPVTMLIIDKKVMPMKDANLPKIVMDQTPKKYLKSKVPVVKAKIGPQIMTLIADDAIFEEIPTKGEVKAMVSGIYIISVKSIRNKHKQAEPEDGKKKKTTLRQRLMKKQAEYQRQLNEEMANQKSKEEIKAEKAKAKKEREREKKIVD